MDVLKKLKKRSIRVTDIASQYWCEKQMELRYLYGEKISKEEIKGKIIHEMLEKEVNVPLQLEPKTYADYVYKILYTNWVALNELRKNKKTRELQIFGFIEGFDVIGKIDELDIRNNKVSVLEDKTRFKDTVPNKEQLLSNKVQVIYYKKLLEDMKSGKYSNYTFRRAYNSANLKISEEFARELSVYNVNDETKEIKKIEEMFFSSIKSIPSISDAMYIRYRNQFTNKTIKLYKLDYKEEELNNINKFIFGYWKGEREALPVPENESWKCNMCIFFKNRCNVWSGKIQK
jgi:hypothetical protein